MILLSAQAQQIPVTDIASGTEVIRLTGKSHYGTFREKPSPDSLPFLLLKQDKGEESVVNQANFYDYFVFSFDFSNSAATSDSFFFMPGERQTIDAFLYDTATQKITRLADQKAFPLPLTLEKLHLHKITLPANSHRRLFVVKRVHFYNWDLWSPKIYDAATIGNKQLVESNVTNQRAVLNSFVLFGILIAILVYTLILYFQYRQREYILYMGYVFFLLLYFLFLMLNFMLFSDAFHRWDMFGPGFTQTIAHLIYFFFVKKILELKKNKPFFNKMINCMIGILLIYLALHIAFSWREEYATQSSMAFLVIRVLLCIFSFYGIVVLYRSGIALSGYIATGVLCLTLLGLISIGLAFTLPAYHPFLVIIGGSITPFKIGVVIELLLFLVAITEKSKREIVNKVRTIELLQVENERKELEKTMIAMETQTKERKRISSEMHDDIGSGLTTIQFLSNALPHDTDETRQQTIRRISATSRQLMDKMNEIVWSLNQEFDTLADTIAYIRNTVSEMLENAGIAYDFHSPDIIPDIQLSGATRRNIYLVMKEATHNIIKHAGANRVEYIISIERELSISIHDNGKGLPAKESRFGNGLINMQNRMKDCGGQFLIREQEGVWVELSLPLGS